MLPVTEHSLVRWTTVNAPSVGVSAELVRYVRSEYGEDAYFARGLIDQAERIRAARTQNGTSGLLRRFLAAITQTAVARATPGGA